MLQIMNDIFLTVKHPVLTSTSMSKTFQLLGIGEMLTGRTTPVFHVINTFHNTVVHAGQWGPPVPYLIELTYRGKACGQ
jgi:hypothetical protein